MIQSLWVVEAKSARSIFNKSYLEEAIDPDLLSSFLTALHQISMTLSRKKGVGIENIDMAGFRWVYEVKNDLIFIIVANKKDDSRILKKQINIIVDLFYDEFKFLNKKDFFKKWNGRRDKFNSFEPILNHLMDQWYSAEKITHSARLLDLLDVYQQVFDAYKAHLAKNNEREFVYDKLKALIKKLAPCFEQVTFRKKMIDLLEIDVITESIDEIELRLGLKKLFEEYVACWDKVLTKKELEPIHKKIQRYIKDDWDRIEHLNLSKFFLTHFL
ncbi:MAG: hypothetical protein ACTSRW_02725 [Candidatus Helarchaeota archaeon]